MKTSLGGVWALRQMSELVKLGADVHVALPTRTNLWDTYRRAGIRVHCQQTDLHLRRPWSLRRQVEEVQHLVDTIQPHIVHSHFVGTTLTMRTALRRYRKLPRIFQVPGPLHLEKALFRKMEIATAQSNDFWIATCSATKKMYLDAGVNSQNVFSSFYGIETELLKKRKTKGKLRAELSLSPDMPVVGMVAYLYAPKRFIGQTRGVKGHEDLIDAIAIVAEHVPDIRVVFIGGAWNNAFAYEQQVLNYACAKIKGKAIFLGNRNDVPELYSDFDIAVHPSHSENLGGAAESLLMEVPTIATRVGGFPDLVIPGKTGYLVPPSQPEQLAEVILHVLQNLEEGQRLASKGGVRVCQLCDVQNTARQIFNIYGKVISLCNK